MFSEDQLKHINLITGAYHKITFLASKVRGIGGEDIEHTKSLRRALWDAVQTIEINEGARTERTACP